MIEAFAIIVLASAAALCAMLWLAPYGYENETGFHLGEQPLEELKPTPAHSVSIHGRELTEDEWVALYAGTLK